MPDSPGFELVRILKHNFPLLPTIITAESPSKEVILSALRNDAKDFLEIPFDKVELVKIIQRVTNAIPLSFDPQTLHRSNQQKVKKSAARLKDFVVRYLTNKRNANNSSDKLGSEITNDSSDHILK
ncbi:MAG: hypothetical protein ACE5I1_12835, partial [bacterium]